MEAYKPDMISCAIEWQPSEAAFDVWPLMTERASHGKRPYSVNAMPDEMMLPYTLMGLSARSPIMDELCERVPTEELDGLLQRSLQEQYEEIELQFD